MTAYYNEIDPFAAQWLRNLINAGHIAPGGLAILHKGMTYAATAI